MRGEPLPPIDAAVTHGALTAMTNDNPLAQHTATADSGAGFLATRERGLAIVTPITPAAGAWLRANVGAESTWNGDSVVVEMRYFPGLADAIIAAGFAFERDPYPN